MNQEIKYSLEKFNAAYNKLYEGVNSAHSKLEKDGVIQRFEFTFEIMWKTLKIYLNNEGLECLTPKSCLQEAFKIGLIKDEEIFLDMLADRNKTSHIYDEDMADEIFTKIKNFYVKHLKKLFNQLKKTLKI